MQSNYGKLVMTAGPTAGEEYDLPMPQTIIGRDPSADIMVPASAVSRRHCRIAFDGTQYTLEDLGSSNGTFVNGNRLTGVHTLRSGDDIALGQAIAMTFSIPMGETVVSADRQAAEPTRMEMAATMMEGFAQETVTSQPPPQPEGPRLVVTVGGHSSQTYTLTAATYTIGRADENDIIVRSPIISRYHARLVRRGDNYILEPSATAGNKVMIDDAPVVGAHALKDGDQALIGRIGTDTVVLFTYQAPAGAAADMATRVSAPGAGATQLLEYEEPTSRAGAAAAAAAAAAPVSQPRPAFTPPGASDDPGRTLIGQEFIPPASGEPVRLEVVVAGGASQTHLLTKDRVTIGRADENDIVVPSRIVSRHQAYLQRTDGGYMFVPLPDAANPIQFEGRTLAAPRQLRHKDLLRIGGQDPGSMVTMTYRSPAEAHLLGQAQTLDFAGRDTLTIGRDASNDLVLDNPSVSRFHAQIERVGQRFRVRDLRSSNGTFVNNERVDGDVWLKPEDSVRIGMVRFVMGEEKLAQYDESGGLRVEAIGLNKWVRKDLNILQNISLVFQPREFVVVVGQSGGGKTTLVDAIAGYRPATHGSVEVNDIDIYRNFDAIRNEIGYVPQRDIIHLELTVFQALDYSAQLRMPPDTTKAERHQRIVEVLEDLDLTHRRDTQISRLSGGQQKRVSIGVELLTKPGLFFLDEPTSGLDPGTETALMQLMRRLADQGRTIVLITHATKNVMLADKVVFLARGGYLAWFGPPDEALAYFDQYRSERDRRARDIEFDEIYAILDDSSKGTAEEWAHRYQRHPAYQQYVAQPLEHRDLAPQAAAASAAPAPKRRRQVSSLRQFRILSSRNVRILTRDRFALLLMLAAAPIVSMLDVVLSLALGRNLFDPVDGSIQNVMITLFLLTVYGVMVGGLAQMREIVKEQDIYKRERLVNLRLFPYILSKIWVAAILALYQSFVYVFVHYLMFDMPGGWLEFALIYVTLALATMSGMMLGLFASALAPNSNSAPLIVVLLVLPQIVLAGALVPLPGFITAVTSTRWAYQSFMAITGAGSDVAADACWLLDDEAQSRLTTEQKLETCRCLGPNILTQCRFPGVIANVSDPFTEPEPIAPDATPPPTPGSPPPEPAQPEFPPQPTPCADEGDVVCAQDFREAFTAWQNLVEPTQEAFQRELDDWRAESQIVLEDAQGYPDRLQAYLDVVAAYERSRAEWQGRKLAAEAGSVLPAEETIRAVFPGFSWTFTNKDDFTAYWSVIGGAWAALLFINGILFVLIIILQKRKDVT